MLRKIKFFNRRLYRIIGRKFKEFNIDKRKRLIASVFILSSGLFAAEHLLGKSGILTIFILALLTDVLLLISLYKDFEENFSWQVLILPFFYSLAIGLFYLLIPARFLTRVVMTSLYALGLYSLYLSQNIFTVSSIRTIALLSSARTVSFAITLLTYFFLTNVVFSLHSNIFVTSVLVFAFTFPLTISAIWNYSLEESFKSNLLWTLLLSLALLEISIILWFWPSTPTLIALFLTGVFYTLVGLSQAWFEKRLFRGVILEYVWVAVVTFFVLFVSTIWGRGA